VKQRLLELGIRGRLLATDLRSIVSSRARSARGQTTIEWLAVMVGFFALITVLAGDKIWARAGGVVVDAVRIILPSDGDSV
jgi:hypothetical protein